uniref:Transposase DDE domain-containing protein n=1 Tax=Desulfacinum infernum TaxID=35837 RepID=A0A831ZWD0_9BACT
MEVFDGNVADPQTLKSQILKVRARFGMERVILVGDRVMITEARLREDIMSHPDYHGQRLIVCRNPLILSTMGNFSLKTLDG